MGLDKGYKNCILLNRLLYKVLQMEVPAPSER
jgi:hypothetical protein